MLKFMETTQEPWHLDKLRFVNKSSWIYIQVLLESIFCSIMPLSIAMVRNFEVMLEQLQNHSVYNSAILCSVISL
jgi:hypothetical protein